MVRFRLRQVSLHLKETGTWKDILRRLLVNSEGTDGQSLKIIMLEVRVKCVTQLDKYRLSLLVYGGTAPQWARASSFTKFLDHTQRRTAVGRTPLDE